MSTWFRFDALALLVGAFQVLFFLLVVVYSLGFMRERATRHRYYLYLVLTLVAAEGVVFADNFVLLLVCWGLVGVFLYLLIDMGSGDRASITAKKTLVIVGGTDAVMLLGFAIVLKLVPDGDLLSLSLSMVRLELTDGFALLAFFCLLSGALAKAGAMPFHTWVPDTARDAPVPVVAYLPASLDKLLGIYLAARLVLEVFRMTPLVGAILMAIGALTIIAAVAMALVQHNLRRLLGYHAVSQVGYMILGLGTGNPIGIAGGLFHMLNNAIYKSALFLCAGNVEREAGTVEMDRLGGLARRIPVTFAAFLVCSLAIAGIPPLNGFASKWLIYQGIIEGGRESGGLWVLWLVAAMFGTALTLASFMKAIHAVFLGQELAPGSMAARGDRSPSLWIPPLLLAFLSLVFGVFAAALPLRFLIFPAVPGEVEVGGVWESGPAAGLLLAGVLFGFLCFGFFRFAKIRYAPPFIGGEVLEEHPDIRVSGVEFYRTVRELRPLGALYRAAEAGWMDPYELGKRGLLRASRLLAGLHNGLLPRYVSWCLLGMLLVLYVLLG